MKPKLCCYIAECPNPIKSKGTMACHEHAQYSCEICGRRVGLVRDHDHACHPGKICVKCFRGFLCPPCNSGLGMFQDDPALLLAAVAYLERPRLKIVKVPPERKVYPGSQKRALKAAQARAAAEAAAAADEESGWWLREAPSSPYP